MECVNCTACIDACDEVMVKIGKPKGLIRFASYSSIRDGVQKLITGRVIGYSLVLVALMAILSFALITRSDVETTFLKVSGTLYQREGNFVTNLYNAEFVNKTFESVKVELKVESPLSAELVNVDGKPIMIGPEGLSKTVYFIRIPAKEIDNARMVVMIAVYEAGRKIETLKVKFIGPVSKASDARRN
jgi:polyferredoxin